MNDIEMQVWKLVRQIPTGYVSSYGDIASALGDIGYSRLVGRILSKNKEPIIIPCHRVVYSDGGLGWYLGVGNGSIHKKTLLESEGVEVMNDRIVDFDKRRFKNFNLD